MNDIQVAKYGLENLDASGGRLGFLPEEIRERPEMACLTDFNLSRNQLFNSDHVFGVLSSLKSLRYDTSLMKTQKGARTRKRSVGQRKGNLKDLSLCQSGICRVVYKKNESSV